MIVFFLILELIFVGDMFSDSAAFAIVSHLQIRMFVFASLFSTFFPVDDAFSGF